MLIDSRTIYAAKLNLRVPVRLQAKKCLLLANTYCRILSRLAGYGTVRLGIRTRAPGAPISQWCPGWLD